MANFRPKPFKGYKYEDTFENFLKLGQNKIMTKELESCAYCANEAHTYEWETLFAVKTMLCADCYVAQVETMKTELCKMLEAYQERCTDVVAGLGDILSGREFDANFVKARFTKAVLPADANGKTILYDLFTGWFEVYDPDKPTEAHILTKCDYTDE